MEPHRPRDISLMLKAWRGGDRSVADEFLPLVYDELRKVAAQYLRRERPGHTLQPTALANEAYLKLVDLSSVDWQDRAHFFAVAANVMRHILVDHARARRAEKRGGGVEPLELDAAVGLSEGQSGVDLLALHEALERLAAFDPQQGKIVELRFFGGLTIEETAAVLDLSPTTVKREWTLAKAWLHKRVAG